MARATSSFPVPVSPVIRTVESLLATFDTCDRTAVWRGGAADNLFEHRGLVDFLSKRNVLLLQFILVSLAILDIGTRDVPPDDLPLVVSERVVTNQKPAIRSVAATQALLHLHVSGAAFQ